MYMHPYVVDQLAEQHHCQLIALARAERLARRNRAPGRPTSAGWPQPAPFPAGQPSLPHHHDLKEDQREGW